MRSREISEVLNEDARINQKAYQKNYPFVQQSKEEWLRPDELDRKTAYELGGFLDKMSSSLSQAVSAMAIPAEAGKLTQGISEFLSAFNRATAYVRLYGRTGKLSSREEMSIQEKFDAVKPSLEQILNAHAAGNPIPEFRAVLQAYDNILNHDLRPVDFSPPVNIPQPAQPVAPGQPAAAPFPAIVGPNAPRPPAQQQGQPAPVVQPAQPGEAPPPPPAEPPVDVPEALVRRRIATEAAVAAGQQGAAAANLAAARAIAAWMRVNRPDIVDRAGYVTREIRRIQAGQPSARERYEADLAAYNAALGIQAAGPAPLPIQPEQPAQGREAGMSRADINLIRELEGNRQAVVAAQAALQGQQGNRQRLEALAVAQRKFRAAETRAIRAGVANVPYDANTMGPPMPPRVGDGVYGSGNGVVSADMAGLDDEYLNMDLHPGFQERGNWSGMMNALQSMPTAPYGAGLPIEEGAEMPIGVFSSSKRMGFVPDADYISESDEADSQSDDNDMYDAEMAGRGQLDDAAETIQANRMKKELNIAKGGSKNMKEMLMKLKSKIRC